MSESMPKSAKSLCSNDTFLAFYDTAKPVTKGHVIIVPREPTSFADLTKQQRIALLDLTEQVMGILKERYKATGFNVGTDIGASAGQVVDCFSLHIIPRYNEELRFRGGMRAVVPERANLALGSCRDEWDR